MTALAVPTGWQHSVVANGRPWKTGPAWMVPDESWQIIDTL
jgi:hypothetical protein